MAFNLGIFKKGLTQGKKAKGAGVKMTGGKPSGPRERKIGIFGHTRAGKTVFLTMLWHQTHGRRDFSLETDDYQTRQDMSSYYDLLSSGEWPPPTATERLYRFTAVIDTTIRYPFESQDYQGESVSIDREVETGKEFLEYFESCDAVFILVDAEDLIFHGEDAAQRRRKKIDSFELMLAQLVEGTRNRLRIPVAIIVTKADLLDGYRDPSQVVLVSDDIRYSRYRGYDNFVSAVLAQKHVSAHLPWREQVEEVLLMMKPLVDYCLTKSPDLQVFFVSSTGGVDTVEQPDGGKSARPPKDLKPIGLEMPFVWSVHLLMQKRRALIARKIKWYVSAAAVLFIGLFSLFNFWHEGRIQKIHRLSGGRSGVGAAPATERVVALEGYRSSFLSRFFKDDFRGTVDLILDYEQARALSAEMQSAIELLDYESFSSRHRALRDLRDQFPQMSEEYRRAGEMLSQMEAAWDAAYYQYKLQPLLARNPASAEVELALKQVFTPDNRREWSGQWSQRQTQTRDELRRQDLQQILSSTAGLGGQSWKALETIATLCQSYLESYSDDVRSIGEWQSAFGTIRQIENLLGLALQSKDSAGELRGIASQLRAVGELQNQPVGARLAQHLTGLSSEAVATSAGEEYDALARYIDTGDLDFRFSEAFKSRARSFVQKYRGTPEGQRVSTFLSRLEAVEKNGLLVAVQASECPPGYHLRLWDAEAGNWQPSDVEPGLPGTLRWKPNEPVKIGIERTDPNNPGNNILDTWEVTDRFALFRIHTDGGRHVFRGNLPVVITFPDIESSLPRL